jgi:hypothetical protein
VWRRVLKLIVPVLAAAPFLILPLLLSSSPHPALSAPRATNNARYASQSTVPGATRKAQIAEAAEDNFDAGYETCSAWGLDALARNLSVRRNDVVVARAFSHGWAPALREAPYQGCLAALHERD